MMCPNCSSTIVGTENFCPNCGHNMHEKPIPTGIWNQISLYLVSVLLPPFGLGWTFKYLKAKDPKAKTIGWISLGLTITALVLGIWGTAIFLGNISDQVSRQLEGF